MTIDFEAEGLLEGTEGEARDGRRKLLEELAEQGVPIAELRAAVEEERLALLPVERVLEGGGERYTVQEVAEASGIDLEFFERQLRANGISIPEAGEAVFTEADVENAKRLARLRAGGLPDREIREMGRVLGMSMSTLAAATRGAVGESFRQTGDTEHDLGLRLAAVAKSMAPLMDESLGYLYRLHLRDQIRRDFVSASALESGTAFGARTVCVAFADLVGFTRLGERVAPEELGTITDRFNVLVADAVSPPVRLVKMIGDAAMLVSAETEPVLETALILVEVAAAEEDFPELRVGVSRGEALPRGGDWYGRPVNLASRITTIAWARTVLCDEEVKEGAPGGYKWSFAGERKLKGIKGEPKLFRCRRNESESRES